MKFVVPAVPGQKAEIHTPGNIIIKFYDDRIDQDWDWWESSVKDIDDPGLGRRLVHYIGASSVKRSAIDSIGISPFLPDDIHQDSSDADDWKVRFTYAGEGPTCIMFGDFKQAKEFYYYTKNWVYGEQD